jgi:hypothetical protein
VAAAAGCRSVLSPDSQSKALFGSGKLLHRVSGPGDAVAWLAIVVSVGFVYSVPAVGIGVAYLLGRDERTSSSELLARRLAHLAVASPPLFVLIGVVFYLLHARNGDSVFWWILWLAGPGCSSVGDAQPCYRGTLLFSDSYWPFSSGENLGTSFTAIAETEGSVQIFNTFCAVDCSVAPRMRLDEGLNF